MAEKPKYKLVLFDKGDKVRPKNKDLFDQQPVYEIEDTELKYVGVFPTLFLKFVGKPKNITDLSNYFEPAAETIEKYKDGLIYFNESKVNKKQESKTGTKSSANVHGFTGRSRAKQDNTLTEEDLKPVVRRLGFTAPPPIKKNDENN
jgi:hypothetical protein